MSALTELLSKLAAELAPLIAAELNKSGPRSGDALLTVKQVAGQWGISPTKVRELVKSGALKRAPDFTEIRIRQSVADAFGKSSK